MSSSSSSLLDQITTRMVALTGHAERLRVQLAEIEDDLDRLRVAEQVVKEILAERPGREPAAKKPATDAAGEPAPVYQVALPADRATRLLPGGRLIPFQHEADGVHALPADYQALLATARSADTPLSCKTICEQLGLSTQPGQVEGTRAKLNRLAERGWLRKTPAGTFAPPS